MSNAETRIYRIGLIENVIKACNEKNNAGANRKRLCVEMGPHLKVSPYKIQEYVQELIDCKKIVQMGEDLWINTEEVKSEFQEMLKW